MKQVAMDRDLLCDAQTDSPEDGGLRHGVTLGCIRTLREGRLTLSD